MDIALLPFLLSRWREHLDRPTRLGQDFGNRINTDRISPTVPKCTMSYYWPRYDKVLEQDPCGASTVTADKDKYHVDLDVQQFAPEEISVKVVDNFVIVEGKHEEKEDMHGWVSRQFTRKYLIPQQCDIDKVSSKLSSDGVLSVIVPRKEKLNPEEGTVINIEYTGKPAVGQETENEKKEEEEEEEEKTE